MRTYEALIRLARFRAEELGKQLAGLAEARADLVRQAEELQASVPEDEVPPTATKEGFVAYGSYAQAVIARKQNLKVSIGEVDAQTEGLRRQLEEARAELEKYEGLESRRLAAERERGEDGLRAAV